MIDDRSHFGSPVQNYEIQVLSEEASLNLLRSLVLDGQIDQDLETAKQICEWLGYLPLGLELVGRYLKRKGGVSIAKLWERLQEQKLSAKASLEAEPGMTPSLGVAAAFELSEETQPDVLLSLNHLAVVYQAQGRYTEAEALSLQDLKLSLLLFENKPSDIAVSLNNLANVYLKQERYKEAEPLLLQALEIYCSTREEAHPDVAANLNNLARF